LRNKELLSKPADRRGEIAERFSSLDSRKRKRERGKKRKAWKREEFRSYLERDAIIEGSRNRQKRSKGERQERDRKTGLAG
jgi:hypothetical protein